MIINYMDILQKLKNNQRRIGLTGGIASGKTTITNYIRKHKNVPILDACLLYTSPSPRDRTRSRMPSSA